MICSKSDSNTKEKVVSALKNEEVVILPTDTVYGFSGIIDKTDTKIRRIKGREENKPFIVLISDLEQLKSVTNDQIPDGLLKFWPGPLTVIVKDRDNPEKTVAVRCPGNEWLRQIIKEAGSPIYSTSVNKSGNPVLTKINDIIEEFQQEVSVIVDDGDSENGIPSTIVKIEENGYSVLRKGAVDL